MAKRKNQTTLNVDFAVKQMLMESIIAHAGHDTFETWDEALLYVIKHLQACKSNEI